VSGYDYKLMRNRIDNDAGQRAVYEALLDAEHLAKHNGLIPHEQLARKIHVNGDSYTDLAVIDRLIECGYIQRADMGGADYPRQGWIYRWTARART